MKEELRSDIRITSRLLASVADAHSPFDALMALRKERGRDKVSLAVLRVLNTLLED